MDKQQRPLMKQHVENEKLSIIRKYAKYFDKDGNPVFYQIKTCRGAEVNCPFSSPIPTSSQTN